MLCQAEAKVSARQQWVHEGP